jgi:hypothetical protein
MKKLINTTCTAKGCGNKVRRKIDTKYLKNGQPTISCLCTTCARKSRAKSSARSFKQISDIHYEKIKDISPVRCLSQKEIKELSGQYAPPVKKRPAVFYDALYG